MYIISPTARREIAECGLHVFRETGSLEIWERWLDKLIDAFHLLAQSPRMGRPRSDLRRGLRSHHCEGHTIFYRIKGEGVEIARVLHQRRDLRKAFPKRSRALRRSRRPNR